MRILFSKWRNKIITYIHLITKHKIYVHRGTTSTVYLEYKSRTNTTGLTSLETWIMRRQRPMNWKSNQKRPKVSGGKMSSGGTCWVWSFDAFSSTNSTGNIHWDQPKCHFNYSYFSVCFDGAMIHDCRHLYVQFDGAMIYDCRYLYAQFDGVMIHDCRHLYVQFDGDMIYDCRYLYAQFDGAMIYDCRYFMPSLTVLWSMIAGTCMPSLMVLWSMIAGTFVSGLTVLCCSKIRPGGGDKMNVVWVNTWVGLLQFLTAFLFLLGWIWSIMWGASFLSISGECIIVKTVWRNRWLIIWRWHCPFVMALWTTH